MKDKNPYIELGVSPIVSAGGTWTRLGGSRPDNDVLASMQLANDDFCDLNELLIKSGEAIADLVGCEAAHISSGGFAALVIAVAGIISKGDPEIITKLPDSQNIPNEFLMPKLTRFRYDRSVSVAGGKLIESGTSDCTTIEDMKRSLTENTVGIFYLARMEDDEGMPFLPETVEFAKENKLSLLVDGGGEVFPLERMKTLVSTGADLISFGTKYFGGFNSTGLLCGTKEMIGYAKLNGFMGFEVDESNSLGRGYKVDRQEVIGTWTALKKWFSIDHEERLGAQKEKLNYVADRLKDIPSITTNIAEGANLSLVIHIGNDARRTATEIFDNFTQERKIWVGVGPDQISVAGYSLREGEGEIVADALLDMLA